MASRDGICCSPIRLAASAATHSRARVLVLVGAGVSATDRTQPTCKHIARVASGLMMAVVAYRCCGAGAVSMSGSDATDWRRISRLWRSVCCRCATCATRSHSARCGDGCLVGIVYSVLLVAWLTMDPLRSAAIMMLFGIGTTPAVLAGALGARAGLRWLGDTHVRYAAAAMLLVDGALTIAARGSSRIAACMWRIGCRSIAPSAESSRIDLHQRRVGAAPCSIGGMDTLADASLQFDADLIRRYDIAGPRYTSYPTAPHFHSRFGEASFAHTPWRATCPRRAISRCICTCLTATVHVSTAAACA